MGRPNSARKRLFFLIVAVSLQTSCLGTVWTGATLIYDRHHVYEKITDYHLVAAANYALYHDRLFKQPYCAIDLAVFNGDILVTGHVPTQKLREIALQRLSQIAGYRQLFNQIDVSQQPNNGLKDSWITTKIRAQIFADARIDPYAFKIITSDQIVYLMGDVRPQQAARVIHIARTTNGVMRVVKLFKYYHLSAVATQEK